MKFFLCCSLEFSLKIQEVAKILLGKGHAVKIPPTAEMIIKGETTLEQICSEKKSREIINRTVRQDSIRNSFKTIQQSDAILVLNYDKNDINNYVGGNVLIEMAFAHVLSKGIFLLNNIPEVSYRDEIAAMKPIILNGDLNKIENYIT